MIDGRNMVMVIGPLKTKAEVKIEADARKAATKEPREPQADAPKADAAKADEAPATESAE
jgi:translation initiation factor IF-3